MNLLELLKEEISNCQITDKLDIARYIYVRCGQIFNYDTSWVFSSDEEKDILKDKKIDIENVTDFDIVCFSWARMYKELLHKFNIPSKVIYIDKTEKKDGHAYVIIFIDGKRYIADLTASNIDISNIKFGMDTRFNCQIYFKPQDDKYYYDNEIKDNVYPRIIRTDDILMQIKKELEKNKKEKNLNKDEYVYLVYNSICTIMNIKRENVGFVSGTQFIRNMLKVFIGKRYIPFNVHYFDKEKNIYIEIYSIMINGCRHYFAYKMSAEGFYELNEVLKEYIEELSNQYSIQQAGLYLKLRK